MKTYLINGVHSGLRQKLAQAGVSYYDWSANEQAILIEESQLSKTLEALEATATESASAFENVRQLTLQPKPKLVAPPASAQKQEEQQSEARKKHQEQALSAARQRYVQVCSDRIRQQIETADAQTAAQRITLLELQKEYVLQCRQQFLGAHPDAEQRKQIFLKELEQIRRLPKVQSASVTNGALFVHTDLLFGVNPETGKRHELGRFLIVISFDGAFGAVRWFNSTRRVQGVRPAMNAPNVFADGVAAIDELRQTLSELISQCDFATVVELSVQFVETVNRDELGKHITQWPCVDA